MENPDRKFWFITKSGQKYVIYAQDEIAAIDIYVNICDEPYEKMFEDFE